MSSYRVFSRQARPAVSRQVSGSTATTKYPDPRELNFLGLKYVTSDALVSVAQLPDRILHFDRIDRVEMIALPTAPGTVKRHRIAPAV